MKKSVCLLLAALMLVALFGCGTDHIRGEIVGGDETPSEPEFSLGTTTGKTYKNDFLGISCTLPDGWVFYTDAQIRELNNLTGEYLDEDVAQVLANATIVYDMFAQNTVQGATMNINMEKLNVVQVVGLDIKKTLEAQIDALKSTYENMGCTDIQAGYQKIKVDGKDFDALRITAKMQGVDMFVVTFAFLRGNYLANVSICSVQTDQIGDILDYFTVQ